MEQAQRERKKGLKTIIPDPSKLEGNEDSCYYQPKFFKKTISDLTGEEMYKMNE